MVNSFLFGNQSSSQSKYLLEFKAGKMQMKGTTVNAINKKGLVYLHRTDDNLMHFCWKDRTTGQVEDDLIIFPDDTEFQKVSQCTTGRVFVLKFKSSNRRCFFWMQEANEDKDEDICKKVNDYLNNPASSRNSSLGQSLSDLPDSDLNNLLNNVNSQQLMQLLSRVNGVSGNQVLANILNQSSSTRAGRHSNGSRSSTKSSSSNNNQESSTTSNTTSASTPVTSAAVAAPTTASPAATSTVTPSTGTSNPPSSSTLAIQLRDIQNIISGLAVDQNKKEVSVDLASVVNSEALKTLLQNKEFMDKVKELIPDTSAIVSPAEQTLTQQVSSTIESIQFKSALSTFNSALQSGLLGPLIQQFNLSEACVEAANRGDLEAFAKAMEESASSKAKNEPKSPEKKSSTGDSEMTE